MPLGIDLTKNDEDRQVMRVVSSPSALGYPSFVAPGVPADRVAAMRHAFDQAAKDPRFIEIVKKQQLPSTRARDRGPENHRRHLFRLSHCGIACGQTDSRATADRNRLRHCKTRRPLQSNWGELSLFG